MGEYLRKRLSVECVLNVSRDVGIGDIQQDSRNCFLVARVEGGVGCHILAHSEAGEQEADEGDPG